MNIAQVPIIISKHSRKVSLSILSGFLNSKLPLFPSLPPEPVIIIHKQTSHCLPNNPLQLSNIELRVFSLCVQWRQNGRWIGWWLNSHTNDYWHAVRMWHMFCSLAEWDREVRFLQINFSDGEHMKGNWEHCHLKLSIVTRTFSSTPFIVFQSNFWNALKK